METVTLDMPGSRERDADAVVSTAASPLSHDKPPSDIWFNVNKPMSYAEASEIYCVTPRGPGKTYGFFKWSIKRYLRHGESMVYLRRGRDNIDKAFAGGTIQQVMADNYPDIKYRILPSKYQMTIDGNPVITGAAIIDDESLKSVGFPTVKTIVLDEFLSEREAYIRNEVFRVKSIRETVLRLRSGKMVFLGNAVSTSNIYFRAAGFLPSDIQRECTYRNHRLLYVPKLLKYKEYKRRTEFGKLDSGTDFGEYAVDNKFLIDDDPLLKKRPKKSTPVLTYRYDGYMFGVWRSGKEYYISEKRDDGCRFKAYFDLADYYPGYVHITAIPTARGVMAELNWALRTGNCFFDNFFCKKIFEAVSKYIK